MKECTCPFCGEESPKWLSLRSQLSSTRQRFVIILRDLAEIEDMLDRWGLIFEEEKRAAEAILNEPFPKGGALDDKSSAEASPFPPEKEAPHGGTPLQL